MIWLFQLLSTMRLKSILDCAKPRRIQPRAACLTSSGAAIGDEAGADPMGCVGQMVLEGQMPWNGQNTSRSAGGNMSPKNRRCFRLCRAVGLARIHGREQYCRDDLELD